MESKACEGPSDARDDAKRALRVQLTMELGSVMSFLSELRKPCSLTRSAMMSYSLATHTTAVLRTCEEGGGEGRWQKGKQEIE